MTRKGAEATSRRWRRSIPAVRTAGGDVWDAGVLDGDVAMHDGVSCASCGVPATSVRAQTARPGRRAVAAYFRIKHKGGEHAFGCEYDFDRQVKLILEDAGPDLMTAQSGLYRLRLPLMAEPERQDDSWAGGGGGDPHTVEWRVLSAAARIQQLLNGYQRHPEAAELFVAEYRGREISWGDFCWDLTLPARVEELMTELTRPEWESDWHPMAVWSWNNGSVTASPGGGCRLTLTRVYGRGAVARLRGDDVGVFARVDPRHRCVMGYGRLDLLRTGTRSRSPELSLAVGHASAVTSWDLRVWPPRAWIHASASSLAASGYAASGAATSKPTARQSSAGRVS